jgi:superfamily II DNA or RNA helicase
MSERLKSQPNPDFIISTTVLSHGVNLPKIEKLFFTYKVENPDLWIQMVARGGRKGEEFQVFALEEPIGLFWSSWKNAYDLMLVDLQVRWTSFFSLKSIDFF